MKTTIKGESFNEISESLEGLTTCGSIKEKNPRFFPWNLDERINLSVPLKEGDTLAELAFKFDVSQESIVNANSMYSRSHNTSLVPISTLLVPSQSKPSFGKILAKFQEPKMGYPSTSLHRKRKVSIKNENMELQQLSLSVRTTSDKKVSFDGSQYNFDDPKMPLETTHLRSYKKQLRISIQGSVFHGIHKGKNLAIKRVPSDTLSKIDFHLFDKRIHHHPNIIRLLGTCLKEGSDSYIVLEYAENGSLKDWIHGGLAIKSHFIAACNCFLTGNQRVKTCLDIATSLQYMHHILNPSYVHGNIKSRNIFLDEISAQNWVLSGKPPLIRDEEKENGSFIKLSDEIKRVLETENAEELRGWIDSGLGENYSFDGAVNLANLARSCVEDDPSLRPNAGEIVEKLLRLVDEEGDHQVDVCESSCKPLVKADEEER
ncbi:Non-specific serine/threonine protein kinase [Handroanthus impetiginosus]|uniref:Non-specific serine/threonine protein kinase n=1 Tax=Handroanthus impetiginosus TaxID=429701 RepID=A0A2G9FZZ2_9LAMI|nr:Non-specific serine/threonine protein kinase [Handroanthus impetiginosus]